MRWNRRQAVIRWTSPGLVRLFSIGILCAAFLACDRGRPVEGFYLSTIGFEPLDPIEIATTNQGNLSMGSIRSPATSSFGSPNSKIEIRAGSRGFVVREPPDKKGFARLWEVIVARAKGETLPDQFPLLQLKASAERPGDWDLVGLRVAGNFQVLPNPVPSALHRVEDPQVREYFHLQDELGRDGEALALAEKLLAAHPNDPWIHALQLDALLAAKRIDEAEAFVAASRDELLKHTESGFAHLVREAERRVVGLRAAAEGRNAAALPGVVTFTMQWPDDLLPYEAVMDGLERALECDVMVIQGRGLRSDPRGPVPNFLHFQVMAKIARAEAAGRLLLGRRDDALRLQAGACWLGQMMQRDGTLIQCLVGTAVRRIGLEGLQTYAFNACETDGDFRELWRHLERFAAAPVPHAEAELFAGEGWLGLKLDELNAGPTPGEAAKRVLVTKAQLELLRMATAARHRLVTQGDFPNPLSRPFSPLLEQIPDDPFTRPETVANDAKTSTSAPLRHAVRPGDETFVCWSVGPDGLDDAAGIPYDPTNGTLSAGDLFVVVPREREIPFPREGVRVDSVQEFMELFPNGLPVDPFADTKTRRLSLIDRRPVTVFSHGPDTDERVGPPDPRIWTWEPESREWLPEPQWTAIQEARRGFQPAAAGMLPGSPGGAAPGFQPGAGAPAMPADGATPAAAPLSHPEAPYDPSNGTISDGDLYWEMMGREGAGGR